jgi:Flp pilus assembly protein TadG
MKASSVGGQSLVEFAIMLPLLTLLLLGIIQFGIIFANYLTLNHAAVVGARTASVAPAATANTDAQTAATQAAQAFIKNGTITVNVTDTTVGSGSDTNAAKQVKVSYSLQLIFPNFFGPNPLPMSATCIMRTE